MGGDDYTHTHTHNKEISRNFTRIYPLLLLLF